MKTVLAALLLGFGVTSAQAVSPEDWERPPEPTETSTECPDGQAWDKEAERCTDVKANSFNDDERYRAARELAYTGRLKAAGLALDAMTDQSSSRVLTYRGFLARKSGDWALAEQFYAWALQEEPNDLLARSYLGMGLAEKGDVEAARRQLWQIRARGGRETWPERALLMTLRGGSLSAY